ncbi:hypothetical protein EES40_14405 [Streptomyces sp. ADI93-02]|nr:hypothetical protein EES40_14405 [Streptomyces sp. ADI93-02]
MPRPPTRGTARDAVAAEVARLLDVLARPGR